MKTIPSDPAAAESGYPWVAFEGRWGELEKAFFNGPTGPNLKDQWTPTDRVVTGLARLRLRGAVGWCVRDERDRPLLQRRGEGVEGPRAAASEPGADSARDRRDRRPDRLHRRSGDLDSGRPTTRRPPTGPGARSSPASARMYVHRARLFLGIGALLIPDHRRDHVAAVARVPRHRSASAP